jgi:hypothetical protein
MVTVDKGVFDVEITHGDRRLAYRFTVEFHEPFHVINADRHYPADFPGEKGGDAVRALYRCLRQAYEGQSLALPIDLNAPDAVE